jgi:hypothetical protein
MGKISKKVGLVTKLPNSVGGCFQSQLDFVGRHMSDFSRKKVAYFIQQKKGKFQNICTYRGEHREQSEIHILVQLHKKI